MEALVVEISSSEDEGGAIPRGGFCRASSFKRPYPVAEDDDDITVLDDISSERSDRLKRIISGNHFQDTEDDCLVLDGDPEKVVADPGDSVDDFEDLVVTAEKGQVACRDFPHPRHLCVKFPFKSTPHEKYCGKCHCYVCDEPAPCLFWAKDNLTMKHCHSSDKDERWKKMRAFFKLRYPKEPPKKALQQSFSTVLSLTTTRTRVPTSRSNQATSISPTQLNLVTDVVQPTICTRPDEQRLTSSTYLRNRTPDKEASSAHINYMSGQNSRVSQSGSRFRSSDNRNTSNLGFHRHRTLTKRSNGNRSSGDNLQRHRNNLNMLHTNNNRPNSGDACSTLQRHVIDIPSSEQMYANGLLHKDSSYTTSDENLNKLWDFLVSNDSEGSNNIQNDPFTGLSLNRIHSGSSTGSSFNRIHNDFSTGPIFNIIQNDSSQTAFNNKLEHFGNPDITVMGMNPNASTRPLPTCVTSNHVLQLLPQSGVSMGISSADDNIQWTHLHASTSFNSSAPEQCISSLDLQNLSCDWLGNTECPSTLETIIDQDWACVEDQNPVSFDPETIMFCEQQQPEWSIPLVHSVVNNTVGQMSSDHEVKNTAGQMPSEHEVNNTAGQMSSEQGFVASSVPDNVSYVDPNSSWDLFTLRQNMSSYFECT